MTGVACLCAGLMMDELVELLCSNLQKDELAEMNARLSAEGMTLDSREAAVKVRCFLPWRQSY